jgi:hypothetical protein
MITNYNMKVKESEMEIRKVLIRTDGIKYIIIPKKSNLKAGDFVKVIKLEENEDDGRKK